MLRLPAFGIGSLVVLVVLQDAFEVVLLAKAVRRRVRLVRFFFRYSWRAWSFVGAKLPEGDRREDFLSIYGPLAMLMMFGLWATGFIVGFGLLRWGLAIPPASAGSAIGSAVLESADSFFTLGSGSPAQGSLGILLSVGEAGLGFGCVGLMIGYLPVLYGHFCQRDALLVRLRARAGLPPRVSGLVAHRASAGDEEFARLLRDCEEWGADLTESHVSYPMLAFYRSQHRDQSWLASLALVLDTCALVQAADAGRIAEQARTTYAVMLYVASEVARSFAGDLGAVASSRLSTERIRRLLRSGFPPSQPAAEDASIKSVLDLGETYEPLLAQLSVYLMLPLPDVIAPDEP